MGGMIVGGLFAAYGLFWVINFIVGVSRNRTVYRGTGGDGDSWVSEDRG